MDVIIAFIRAIPSAAASPLALIAYLATLVAWVIIAFRVNRFRELMKRIELLPEADRLAAIKAEMGRVDVPRGLTGEQYLRMRIHTFLLIAFLALCGTVATVGLKAGYDVYQQMIRADNLTREILAPPSSDYMSAVNTLSNGPQMVMEAAAEIRPSMSKAELDDTVDRLARQRLNGEQINRRLAELAGTGRLQRANAVLAQAAARVDDAYGRLAACFRKAECRPGFEADMLCQGLIVVKRSIDATNDAGWKIPGVNYNASGAALVLGGGSMDIDFSKIAAGNVEYLLTASCAA
jgi:hypothetical protein